MPFFPITEWWDIHTVSMIKVGWSIVQRGDKIAFWVKINNFSYDDRKMIIICFGNDFPLPLTERVNIHTVSMIKLGWSIVQPGDKITFRVKINYPS
jgi:hypothetical protein